jgi:hypothetical protein
MTEPMTLEEAIAACPIIPCNYEGETLTMLPVNVARTLKAHAERTVAARSGEPQEVTSIRALAQYSDMRWDMMIDRRGAEVIVAYLDTLTAERDAARAKVAAFQATYKIAAESGEGLLAVGERLIELTGERDRLAACVERVRGWRDEWLNEDPAYCAVEREVTDVLRRQFDRALEGA